MNYSNNGTFRLTALWALGESGLGGIMHALKIPFTGIFVGGFAVLIISLLAWLNKNDAKQILKATLLVIIVKATASPHSPVPAYVAVAFQGLCGALIYKLIPHFFSASILFGFIAMIESALQKLIITTLIFGKSFWIAIDNFFQGILKDLSLDSGHKFSIWLIIAYTGIYALWGLILGYWAARMPRILDQRRDSLHEDLQKISVNSSLAYKKARKSSWKLINFSLALLFIVLVLLFSPGDKSMALYAFIRAAAAMLLLFFFVNPLLLFLIRRFSGRQKELREEEYNALLNELNRMKNLSSYAYQLAASRYKGIKRIREFVIILILCSLKPSAIES